MKWKSCLQAKREATSLLLAILASLFSLAPKKRKKKTERLPPASL